MNAPARVRGIAHLSADGFIKVFVGGYYSALSIEEAIALERQIHDAVTEAQVKGSEAPTA